MATVATAYVNVRIPQGELRGKVEKDRKGGNYCSFYSIPYAKPPIGELRFKAPQPAESWTGVRDALEENPGSYAHHSIRMNEVVGQEDCLYLNVYTKNLPGGNSTNLKPVLVWIHGGAYSMGSGRTELYSPIHLMTEDVVVVTINYRLGLLGFMSFKDPTIGIPGNAGLKDMLLSLKWVQKNIEHFNGDPNNVTIAGESAGAASTHLLMLSPLAKGLFHRAIAMSGCALCCWAMSDCGESALAAAKKGLNMTTTDENEIYEAIKDLPAAKILEIQDKCGMEVLPANRWSIGPVIETGSNGEPVFITEKPTDLVLSGKYNKVPLMIGFTDKEGIFLEYYTKMLHGKSNLPNDFEKYIPNTLNFILESDISLETAEKIKQFYYGNQMPTLEDMEPLYRLDTDTIFAVDIMRAVKGHTRSMTEPVYMYMFSADTNLNMFKKLGNIKAKGAGHADDLSYLFKCYLNEDIQPGSIEEKCVNNMVKLYTNFMRSGNPNSKTPNPAINAKWLSCTNPDELDYMDIGNEVVAKKNPKKSAQEFWEKIYAIQPDKIRH